jgi:hypothetical protein
MLNQKTSEGQFYDFGKLAKSPFIRLKVGKIAIFFVLKLAKSPFFRLKVGKIAIFSSENWQNRQHLSFQHWAIGYF